MNLQEGEEYFAGRTQELLAACNDGTAWVFVFASTLVEYLAKLVNGQNTTRQHYIQFIKDYMAKIRPEYATFSYQNGNQDLPEQMYHILRCGIVHSFSFVPDQQAMNSGGRERSIVLSHRTAGRPHLSSYSSVKAPDAAIFVAEDFVEDIEKAIRHIFSDARSRADLKANIETWLSTHPPIMAPI